MVVLFYLITDYDLVTDSLGWIGYIDDAFVAILMIFLMIISAEMKRTATINEIMRRHRGA